MNASEFRTAFIEFTGPDHYRQLIRYLNSGGRWRCRFLYWQEELLARFAAAVPLADVAFENLEPLLRVCDLHGVELIADREAFSIRCRGGVSDFTRAAAERFPNIDCGPIETGHRFDSVRHGLWCCPVCRLAEAEYVARQLDVH